MSVKKSETNGEKKPSAQEKPGESNSPKSPDQLPPQSETPAGEAPPVSDLSVVVQESQEALNDTPPPVIKNKGGRPKGSKTKNRSVPTETSPQAPASPEPEKVTLAPILAEVAGVPFKIAATRTGFEGFQANLDEKMAIGVSLDKVIEKYFPQLSEKAGVEVMCLFTIASVSMSKYAMYMVWIEGKRAQAAEQAKLKTQVVKPPQPVVESGEPPKSEFFS